MEQLQLAVMLWSSIGIAACIAVLCLLGWNKKRNPDFLTSRASPRDMLKARKIIIGFLGSFIIYACCSCLSSLTWLMQRSPWL